MKKSILKSLMIFSLFLIIPIASIISSKTILNDVNSGLQKSLIQNYIEAGDNVPDNIEFVTVQNICGGVLGKEVTAEFKKLCNEAQPLLDVNFWAWKTIQLAATTIILILFFAFISHSHPIVLLWSMRLCMLCVTISSIILVIAQSILLLVTLYYIESYYTGYITPKILCLIGLIAFYATVALFKSLFIAFKKKSPVLGIEVDKNTQEELWKFVNNVAKKVGTAAPDNIIVGLGDNYFVTESDVLCFSGNVKGRTLFISLSLLAFLTINELESILAHEMAHFKGKDTIYSVKIAPTFEKITYGLKELNALDSVLVYPISALIYFFVSIFELKNAHFDKQREYIADDIGAKVSSSKVFANALAKVTFFGYFWKDVEQECYKALKEGNYLINENEYFRRYMSPDNFKKDKALDAIMSLGLSHPRDSHPSLQERLMNLHIEKDEIKLFMKKNEKRADIIINNLSEIEENLSVLEQQLLNDRINVHATENVG